MARNTLIDFPTDPAPASVSISAYPPPGTRKSKAGFDDKGLVPAAA
jgi:hypothetical protein